MKKDRIRGKFTVVNEVSVSRPSPRLLLSYMHRSELQSAAGVSPIPTVVMEIPEEVRNLKDRPGIMPQCTRIFCLGRAMEKPWAAMPDMIVSL